MKPTTKPTDIGANRTGIASSPADGQKLVDGARQGVASPSFDLRSLGTVRASYNDEAEPIGTVSPPATVKGAVKTLGKAFLGEKATVLIDLMAGRLGFERTGTRLYEALLTKLEAADPHPEGPTRSDLEEIRDQELAHAALLADGLQRLGADPTALTPTGDVNSVASEGILKVICDPRMTLTESLQAILIAELADNAAWATLISLAEKMGQDELGDQFREALAQEEIHLELVSAWVQSSLEGQAGVARAPAAPPPAAPTPPV